MRTPTASWIAFRIAAFDDLDFDLGQVQARRHDVVREVRIELPACAVEQDLLLQREADPHRDTTLHLALDQHRIDGRAAVVGGDDADDLHLAGFVVDVDLGDLRRVDVGGERFALPGLRVQRRGLRIVGSAAYRRPAQDGEGVAGDVSDRQLALRIVPDLYAAVPRLELIGRHAEQRRRRVE